MKEMAAALGNTLAQSLSAATAAVGSMTMHADRTVSQPPHGTTAAHGGSATDEAILELLASACLRAEQESGTAQGRSLRHLMDDVSRQVADIATSVAEVKAQREAAATAAEAEAEQRRAERQRLEEACGELTKTASESLAESAAARQKESADYAALAREVVDLKDQLAKTANALADSLRATQTEMAVALQAVAESGSAAAGQAMALSASARAEVAPATATLALLADELRDLRETLAGRDRALEEERRADRMMSARDVLAREQQMQDALKAALGAVAQRVEHAEAKMESAFAAVHGDLAKKVDAVAADVDSHWAVSQAGDPHASLLSLGDDSGSDSEAEAGGTGDARRGPGRVVAFYARSAETPTLDPTTHTLRPTAVVMGGRDKAHTQAFASEGIDMSLTALDASLEGDAYTADRAPRTPAQARSGAGGVTFVDEAEGVKSRLAQAHHATIADMGITDADQEISAGEIIMCEDYSIGELVELIPITNDRTRAVTADLPLAPGTPGLKSTVKSRTRTTQRDDSY
jgi:hypothetical protein